MPHDVQITIGGAAVTAIRLVPRRFYSAVWDAPGVTIISAVQIAS